MDELIFSGTRVGDGRLIRGDVCMCENGKVYIFIQCNGNYVKLQINPDSLRITSIERR